MTQHVREIGQDHAQTVHTCTLVETHPWDESVSVNAGYSPQDISHHDFNEAGGVTCMADFTYEAQVQATHSLLGLM